METKLDLLETFEHNRSRALEALSNATDEVFQQPWRIYRGETNLFSGPRYAAYRSNGMNQIVHHHAQLGTYIRALNLPLPEMYGPSADGI